MNSPIAKAWTGFLRPMLQRPSARQVAALCWRERDGRTEIVLITSRGSGRWIVPKGWPVAGLDDAQSALVEAWEEAGVKPAVDETGNGAATGSAPGPIGSYSYVKASLTLRVDLYAVRVGSLARRYPEAGQRRRRWVSPRRAADLVQEPALAAFLRNM